MKNQVYFGIMLRIIFLFAVGMAGTYIPENLREFFGDVALKEYYNIGVDPAYSWGARHYWYFNMMIILFLFSGVNVVIS